METCIRNVVYLEKTSPSRRLFHWCFFFFFLTSPLRNIKEENTYFPQAEASVGSQVALGLSSALLIHQRGAAQVAEGTERLSHPLLPRPWLGLPRIQRIVIR